MCIKPAPKRDAYKSVEANVPRSPLQVRVDRGLNERFLPPGQPRRPRRRLPCGRRPQRLYRRRVRVDGGSRAGDARRLPAHRRHGRIYAMNLGLIMLLVGSIKTRTLCLRSGPSGATCLPSPCFPHPPFFCYDHRPSADLGHQPGETGNALPPPPPPLPPSVGMGESGRYWHIRTGGSVMHCLQVEAEN